MNHLDDLPERHENHNIQEVAETAFRAAISECDCFVIQKEDRYDYGTDFELEVKDGKSMTNIRVHAQLKGTTASTTNSDAPVSRSIERTNLNYLLQQQSSVYICYHIPSKRLLVRYAEDVYHEYEHKGNAWHSQQTITVRFSQIFDSNFQNKIKNRVIALSKLEKTERLGFISSLPDKLTRLIKKSAETVVVSSNQEQAKNMLVTLHEQGKDEVVSNSFEQFLAVLGDNFEDMMLAYMSEINLSINGVEFDKSRIHDGILGFENLIDSGKYEKGSIFYTLGNAWFGVEQYEIARDYYNSALSELDNGINTEYRNDTAMCYKNMGSVLERLCDSDDTPITFYKRALELNPQLSEAHFSIALCYNRLGDFTAALDHIDQIILQYGSDRHNPSLLGWRVEILFNCGDYRSAFRDINSLFTYVDDIEWVLGWCCQKVSDFGRGSPESAKKSIVFWDRFLIDNPNHVQAKSERLLCFWYLKSVDEQVDMDFQSFKEQAIELINDELSNDAFLWDRVGHWAEFEEDWPSAVECYRKAYDLKPEEYGYCLGQALNFTGQYDEALPILIDQAENHLPDAMSWFQVAIACEGVGDLFMCLFAYHKAVELDPEYDLALFNLGGTYWNLGDEVRAKEIWTKATTLFPEHELTQKIQQDMPFMFEE